MTRSIMFREGGSLPPAELLSLLATAVGGAEVTDQAQQFHAEMRDLLRFTAGVVRTPVNQPRSESSPSVAGSTASDSVNASSGPRGSSTAGLPEELAGSATDGGRLDPLFAGAKRFANRGKAWWWIPAGGVALAAGLLILSPSHSGVRSEARPQSISPEVETRAPEAGAESKAVGEAKTSPPATLGGRSAASGLPAREVPARKNTDSEWSSGSRMLSAGAATSATAPGAVKEGAAPQAVAPGRSISGGQAPAQVREQPERSSHLTPPSARNVPGLHPAERSPSHKIASSPSRRGVLDVSSGVMGANLISAPTPEYPRLASAMHLQGAVILQAVIGKNGFVLTTHVLRGHFLLRGAAEQAVRKWRYRPFVSDGHPVDVATVVTVEFHRNH